jgi:hypothetical protein
MPPEQSRASRATFTPTATFEGRGNKTKEETMRSLLIAAAGALMFTILLSGVPDEADARGSGKAARARTDAAMTAKTSRRAKKSRRARTKVAAAKRPGSCGTYMYWKGGRCQDARDKKK